MKTKKKKPAKRSKPVKKLPKMSKAAIKYALKHNVEPPKPKVVYPWERKRVVKPDPSIPVLPSMSKVGRERPKDNTMNLPEAMVEAASASRINKSYVYINLDNNGDATLSKKFEKQSSVFCYYNGGQVSMDEETSMPVNENSKNNLNNNSMAQPKKGAAKSAAKSNLVTVAGLTYKGKPVAIPAARAKKWTALLNKLYGK